MTLGVRQRYSFSQKLYNAQNPAERPAESVCESGRFSFCSPQSCTPLSHRGLAPPVPAPPRGEPSYHRQQRETWRSGRVSEKFASPLPNRHLRVYTWLPLRGHEQRPRPADEAGSCEWRSAPIFAKAFIMLLQKSAKRKRNWRDARKGGETERGAKAARSVKIETERINIHKTTSKNQNILSRLRRGIKKRKQKRKNSKSGLDTGGGML